ncbi:MAG: molybdenum ABC transporter ATP-binding protein [Gammaproteobacteria bacterium]|nr:molybdenum ABC transporter ATP-binding protein [Gammaproteobacteria bacterium]
MNSLHVRLQLQRKSGFQLELDSCIPGTGFSAVYGPSGCGKTSLLYCLAGLIRAGSDSEIRFGEQIWQRGDQFLPTHRRRVGLVFQDARLFPHLSVDGNLAYAEKRRHPATGPSRDQVCEWLQLQNLQGRRSSELSRGQQQRVAIARALLGAPDILLMDEPLANIDLASRSQILGHLERLQRESQLPIVYVSHDMEEIARLADWLLVMQEGRIIAEGPMLDLCSHLQLALAHEEQAAAIVTASVVKQDREYGLTELSLEGQSVTVTTVDAAPGTRMRLRIPARDISLCLNRPEQTSILNVLSARIVEIEATGSSKLLVRLQLGEQYLLARLTRKSIAALRLTPGQQVFAQIKTVALLSHVQS